MGQWLSIPYIVVGSLIFYFTQRKNKKLKNNNTMKHYHECKDLGDLQQAVKEALRSEKEPFLPTKI